MYREFRNPYSRLQINPFSHHAFLGGSPVAVPTRNTRDQGSGAVPDLGPPPSHTILTSAHRMLAAVEAAAVAGAIVAGAGDGDGDGAVGVVVDVADVAVEALGVATGLAVAAAAAAMLIASNEGQGEVCCVASHMTCGVEAVGTIAEKARERSHGICTEHTKPLPQETPRSSRPFHPSFLPITPVSMPMPIPMPTPVPITPFPLL